MKKLTFQKAGERFSGWSHSALSDNLFWLFLFGWLVPIIVSAIYIFLNYSRLPAEVPLFYSQVWGENQLAKTAYIYLPTAGVFLLGIADLALAVSFHSRDRVFAYLLSGTAVLLAVLAAVTTLNIVNLMK